MSVRSIRSAIRYFWCRKWPKLTVCCLFVSTVVFCQVYYDGWLLIEMKNFKSRSDSAGKEPKTHSTAKITQPRNITILMWTEFCHSKIMTDTIRARHPLPSWCNVTFDRRVLNQSEAIVFHIAGTDLNMNDLPPRRPEVPWVYFILESPIHMQRDAHEFNGYFNRTMSYRLDSDFFAPYGLLVQRQVPLPANPALTPDFSKNKTKLVAWMASHCRTSSERELVVQKLRSVINVDSYGDCGDLKCDKNLEFGCYEQLGQEYLFYLSFENSLCKDYITEKFTNPLKYNLVPIVYGSGNYSSILSFPKKSFINVRDYGSAKELADYLKYLDQNRTAYAEYFEWRKYYDVRLRHDFYGFNKLCDALKSNKIAEKKVYSDVYKWWTEEAKCKHGLDLNWSQ